MELAKNHNMLLILASFERKKKNTIPRKEKRTNTYWASRRMRGCLCKGRSLEVTFFKIADVPGAR